MRYVILILMFFMCVGVSANSDVRSCHQALPNTTDSLQNGLFFYQPSEPSPQMRAPIYIVKDGSRLLECRTNMVTSTLDGTSITQQMIDRTSFGRDGEEIIGEIPATQWPARNLLVDGRSVASVTYNRNEVESFEAGSAGTVRTFQSTISTIDRNTSSSADNSSESSSDCTDIKDPRQTWQSEIFQAYREQVRMAYQSWRAANEGQDITQCSTITGFDAGLDSDQEGTTSDSGSIVDNEDI